MKKRLLFACAMLISAVSGFAQSVGDNVYTPTGKYQISGENILAGAVTPEFTGWVAYSADEAATAASQFNYIASGDNGAFGYQSAKEAVTEGMAHTINGIEAGQDYVVVLKIAQPAESNPRKNTRVWQCAHLNSAFNLINITGTNFEDETDVVEYNVPTEILPGANTYCYAIPASDVARAYSIKLMGISADLYINDIQVLPATQIADERLVSASLEHAKLLLNLEEWPASDYLSALKENIEAAEAADASTSVEDMIGIAEGLREAINEFQNNVMDQQLTSAQDRLALANGNLQKQGTWGVWSGYSGGAGRIHSANNTNVMPIDVGHYAGNTKWGFGNGCNGLIYKATLAPGSYIFSVKTRALCREQGTSTCWDENPGLNPAYGVIYCRPVGDETAEANIVATNADYEISTALGSKKFDMLAEGLPIQNIENPSDKAASRLQEQTIVFKVETEGDYEIGIKSYAQDWYGASNGGTMEVYDAQFYAKTAAKYTKAQYEYEEDVLGQIKAARDNLTTAAANLANAEKPWGKAALKEVADAVEPVVVAYEAKTEDEIMATYDKEMYDKTKGLEAMDEDGTFYYRLMASEVYREAAKLIIAANNEFNRQNGLLDALDAAIAKAEEALKFRVYDYAEAKAPLQNEVATAKKLLETLKAGEYSEENETAINDEIAALGTASDALATSLPADKVTALVDIDFNAAPVAVDPTVNFDEANGEATITGAQGTMLFSNFSNIVINNASQIGYAAGEEILCQGIVHVGNGTGTVEIDVPADNFASDVIRVSMDWWFGSLSGKNCGFYLKDAEDANIGGLFFSPYSNTSDYDPCSVRATGYVAKGKSGVENDQICMDDNKTHMEYYVDYGNKIMYVISNTPKGVYQTKVYAIENTNPIAKFVLTSNYNNTNRRSWFDNLKIERIAADPATVDPTAAIQNVTASKVASKNMFNVAGQRVGADYKGIVIMNGKKVIR